MSAFTGEEKVDLLLKKVAYGVSKTGTSETKGPDGEPLTSFTAVQPSHVWKEATATNIPFNTPTTTGSTAQVGVYVKDGSDSDFDTTGNTIAPKLCTGLGTSADMPGVSGFKRAWDTGVNNWIGPSFGGNYAVKVYVGGSSWDGQTSTMAANGVQEIIFGSNSNADWFFDYEAGVVYWTNEESTDSGSTSYDQSVAFTNTSSLISGTDKVYVAGYTYIGDTGVGGGGIALTDFSVASNTASGSGTLTYDDAGEFTYTPPLLSGFQSSITGAATTIVTADLDTDRALVSNGDGKVAVSDVTATEIGYLDGVTSGIQAQIDTKQATITGGATTIVSDDLSASLALVSDSSGKVAVSAVTATELGYLDGVTSSIQTQIDTKQATITGGATTIVSDDLGASLALISNASGKVAVSAVTATELGYLDGVTSGIQAQIDTKQATITGGATTIVSSDLTVSRALVSDASGKVVVSDVTSTEIGYLDGVTSAIQAQIDTKVTANSNITAATKTKITFDAKGLVTAGADLVASDIPDISATYLTSESFTSVSVAEAPNSAHKVLLTATAVGGTTTGVVIDSADLTFTPSGSTDRGKLTTGDLLVKGDFTVLGAGTVVNLQQENVYVKDTIITLGITDTDATDISDATVAASDVGIEAFNQNHDATASPTLLYDISEDYWTVHNKDHADSTQNKIAEKFTTTVTAAATNAITHNLNTTDVLVQCRVASTEEVVFVKYVGTSALITTIHFGAGVVGTNVDVVIIG